MSSQIDALKTRRFAVWQAMHDLANVAAGENRAFTEFEQGQWEPLSTELDSIDRRIDALLEVEKREAGAAAEFDKFARGVVERPDLPGARAGGTGMFESRSTWLPWLPWLPSYARYRELEQRAVGPGSKVYTAPEQATIWYD